MNIGEGQVFFFFFFFQVLLLLAVVEYAFLLKLLQLRRDGWKGFRTKWLRYRVIKKLIFLFCPCFLDIIRK